MSHSCSLLLYQIHLLLTLQIGTKTSTSAAGALAGLLGIGDKTPELNIEGTWISLTSPGHLAFTCPRMFHCTQQSNISYSGGPTGSAFHYLLVVQSRFLHSIVKESGSDFQLGCSTCPYLQPVSAGSWSPSTGAHRNSSIQRSQAVL